MNVENLVGKNIKVISANKAEWDEANLLYDEIVIEVDGRNFILKADSWQEACLSVEEYSQT